MTIDKDKLTVVAYVRPDGLNPHWDWFDSLDPRAAAKISSAVARLEFGNLSRVKWIGTIGDYRIDWGPRYRIYLAKDGWGAHHPPRRRHQAAPERRHRAGKGDVAGIQGAESGSGQKARQATNGIALTRHFKETVVERVRRDPAFAEALLEEAATLLLNGEVSAAGLVLRDFVNATVGFEARASETVTPAKTLHGTLSRNGNPTMDNLAAILAVVRKRLGVEIQAHVVKAAYVARRKLRSVQGAYASGARQHVANLARAARPAAHPL